jgi:hypothetical protein
LEETRLEGATGLLERRTPLVRDDSEKGVSSLTFFKKVEIIAV